MQSLISEFTVYSSELHRKLKLFQLSNRNIALLQNFEKPKCPVQLKCYQNFLIKISKERKDTS